jgi:transposase InsO family protein
MKRSAQQSRKITLQSVRHPHTSRPYHAEIRRFFEVPNCHDNAVAKSFFSSLKRERIRGRTHKTRAEAWHDLFDYAEIFYNPARKQVRNGMLSPTQFERQQIVKAEGFQKN